ncbi:MAG: thiamine-phosphate kinase [Flavobacteriaceae bacterium]|nr:thiamine-phosphate kinase [Flavobacteriaceae bacterium]
MLENKKPAKTPIDSLGEFTLIEHLTKSATASLPSTVLGIGDDAAVLKHKGETVVSTDMLIEGVHFDLAYMPLKHLGYKAVVVNLSDIYAMNAQATQVLVSLAVSNRFPLEAVEELYAGIHLACKTYGVDLVGGDTTSAQQGLQLSVTALGAAPKTGAVLRSGASENDLLVVSGDIGGAYMGLQVLARENEVFKANPKHQPDLEPYSYLVERQLKPEARKDIVQFFQDLDLQPTSMIDISDGLSSEVMHLCKQSGVGSRVYENKIPLDPQFISVCEEFNLDSTTIALSGGEDYELLFTIKQTDFDKIKGNPNLTVIGHMTAAGDIPSLVTRAEEVIPLKAQGWKAF